MKKISLIIVLTLISAFSAGAVGLAKMCSAVDGVTAITITKQMMGFLSKMQSSQFDFASLAGKLNQVEIVNVTDPSQVAGIETCVKKYLKNNSGYEELLSMTDDEERINLYLNSDPSGLNEYLIIINESDELTVVLLQGSITPDEVSNYTNIPLISF
ncbi:MAG: DUF4252 domain-containing protein [Muribaculaceae bacterium]|nr:DUF4252 domain-containing protein [Muribaculaceae bacterium]